MPHRVRGGAFGIYRVGRIAGHFLHAYRLLAGNHLSGVFNPCVKTLSAAKRARFKAVRQARKQIDYDHQLLGILLKFTRRTFWRLPAEQRSAFAEKVREFGEIHTPDPV